MEERIVFYLCTYSGRASHSADRPWHRQTWCPLPTSLKLCSSAPRPACRLWLPGKQANRTQWTRRIIFVEGRDRDRLSHNSPHHQYFTPSREPNKSLWQIIISWKWWLAHLDVLNKELQQKGFIPRIPFRSYTPQISRRPVSDKLLTYHTDNLISACQT